jgi:surfactin synthase thioesterase subunit
LDLDPALWIRRFHEMPDAFTQLVCFPHAGGAATFFRPLSGAMTAGIQLRAVQYPGRQDRRLEPCASTVGQLADALLAVLGNDQITVPTVFFGHSMGAIVAFEVMRRCENELAGGPIGLIASGHRAPSISRVENLHSRSDDAVVDEMRRLNGTDASFLSDPDVRAMKLPAMRGDYRAIETFRYEEGPALAAPIHAFIGTSDPRVSIDEAMAWPWPGSGTPPGRSGCGGSRAATSISTTSRSSWPQRSVRR